MKRPTIKINLALLDVWFAKAVKRILADLANPECPLRQDYFTATDLEACIKLIAAEESEEVTHSDDPAKWWGYGGRWTRLVIVDKPYGHRLLDLCRDFLRYSDDLEGHNFGRGHCSGMRFRLAGTGKSEAEKKTIEKKDKPKTVHAKEQGDKPSYQRKAICQAGIVRKPSWGSSHRRNGPITTDDPTKVTCKRCLNLLRQLPAPSTSKSSV